jgi:flagellar hook-associated protein 2
VVAKVNAVSETSGITATAIMVSAGNYRLSFKATETGTDQNYDIVVQNPGIFNVGFAIQQAAVDAEIEFDGTTIFRGTNSIDDIVDGVTFNLLQETPGGTTLEVSVEPDTELAKQGILNFVNAYNEFRLFFSRQSEVGANGLPLETAVLVNNPAMRLSMSRISNEMSRVVEGITAGDPARLADVGITFNDYPGDDETPFTRNIMTVDEDALESALQSDYTAVSKVFQFTMISDDPNLQVFSRTNALGVSDFSLNINQTGQVFQATYTLGGLVQTVNLDKTDLGGGSITLSGQSGTALEGLILIYADSGDSVVDVTISQGIGDRTFNALDTLLEEDTGTVDLAQTAIENEDARYTDEITRIDEIVERFRERLLLQFSALESAISSANTLLQSLDAQSRAQSGS